MPFMMGAPFVEKISCGDGLAGVIGCVEGVPLSVEDLALEFEVVSGWSRNNTA